MITQEQVQEIAQSFKTLTGIDIIGQWCIIGQDYTFTEGIYVREKIDISDAEVAQVQAALDWFREGSVEKVCQNTLVITLGEIEQFYRHDALMGWELQPLPEGYSLL